MTKISRVNDNIWLSDSRGVHMPSDVMTTDNAMSTKFSDLYWW